METITFPNNFTAGVNFSASVIVSAYPAPEWVVSAYLRGPDSIDLTAEGNNTEHKFAVSAAETATWASGTYWVSIRATRGADAFEITKRQLDIQPDLATVAAPYDGRSQNEVALEAINAVLAKRATIDQQRYTINNRELWRTNIADLLKLRSFYTVAVRRERRRAAGETGFGRAISVRFSP